MQPPFFQLQPLLCCSTIHSFEFFHLPSLNHTPTYNYRDISLSVVGKIYAGVRKVTEGLIDDEQGELRTGRGCVNQIFTLKQIGEKAREKKT